MVQWSLWAATSAEPKTIQILYNSGPAGDAALRQEAIARQRLAQFPSRKDSTGQNRTAHLNFAIRRDANLSAGKRPTCVNDARRRMQTLAGGDLRRRLCHSISNVKRNSRIDSNRDQSLINRPATEENSLQMGKRSALRKESAQLNSHD